MDTSLNILKLSIYDLAHDIVQRELKNEDCSKLRLRARYVGVTINALNRALVKFPDDTSRQSALATYAIYVLGNYMRTNDVDRLYADVVQIKSYDLPNYSMGGYDFVVRNTSTGSIERVADIGASLDIVSKVNQNTLDISESDANFNNFKTNEIGEEELITNAQVVKSAINEVVGYLLQPFTDYINFTYNGSNNTQLLSFEPNSFGSYTKLNGVDLNPYMDFQYDGNTIIINGELLIVGTQYSVITNYYKAI